MIDNFFSTPDLSWLFHPSWSFDPFPPSIFRHAEATRELLHFFFPPHRLGIPIFYVYNGHSVMEGEFDRTSSCPIQRVRGNQSSSVRLSTTFPFVVNIEYPSLRPLPAAPISPYSSTSVRLGSVPAGMKWIVQEKTESVFWESPMMLRIDCLLSVFAAQFTR